MMIISSSRTDGNLPSIFYNLISIRLIILAVTNQVKLKSHTDNVILSKLAKKNRVFHISRLFLGLLFDTPKFHLKFSLARSRRTGPESAWGPAEPASTHSLTLRALRDLEAASNIAQCIRASAHSPNRVSDTLSKRMTHWIRVRHTCMFSPFRCVAHSIQCATHIKLPRRGRWR